MLHGDYNTLETFYMINIWHCIFAINKVLNLFVALFGLLQLTDN
jgi:hypothetical protein